MSSREKILSTVEANQPPPRELPPLPSGDLTATAADLESQFVSVLESIGGAAYFVSSYERIATILHEQHPEAHRIISGCAQLQSFQSMANVGVATPTPGIAPLSAEDPHTLENVDLAILPAHFGVAENGACWITEMQMLHRVLPFITQHLSLVIYRRDIVADMHKAYERIALPASGDAPYGFATFIAGPSKTADIEQSLVLGAHGPISLTVFLLDEELSDAGFY